MKLVELDSTAPVECLEEPPVEQGVRAEEGLAEQLCRVVRDEDAARSLHALLGPFCHQSRNILNSLKLGLYLASQQEASNAGSGGRWKALEHEYGQFERLYDRLQAICRPMSLTRVRLALSLLLDDRRSAWVASFSRRGRVLEMIPPVTEDVGEYDPNWLGQALDAFVVWRAEARDDSGGAQLRWWTEPGRFAMEWIETELATRTEPGIEASDSETCVTEPIESLALPLLGRVITAHGGALEQDETAGRHIRMSWPLTARLP